ncbi:AraC family transcriptional regulator [Chitinophaga horti]|uniref:AraC family transcriptional regulator n=1 Tax=Chitinophaga horti TaxID=2920382 RepID=A0ABY6J614_9BACT|nr:AraC family transcriptional regulator [Chitinophaga horti]UYQ94027.1 AraC family transcriptional regulator [Chitinophaga horti]
MLNEPQLPVVDLHEICKPLKDEQFSLFRHEREGVFNLTQAHKHNFFMLFFVTAGGGLHHIDFTKYEVTPGSVFFLAPGQAHNWDLQAETTGFQLMYGPEFCIFPARQWPFFSAGAHPLIQPAAAAFEGMLQELTKMEEEYSLADMFSIRLLNHRLWVLLTLLERSYEQVYPLVNASGVRLVVKNFLELLEQHYKDQGAVEFYADQLHITPQYLNIACKKETGLTAGHCIRSRLVLEAKRMLSLTAQDVKEIAFDLGFSDSSYFSRFFRRYGGVSPVEFRRAAQRMP